MADTQEQQINNTTQKSYVLQDVHEPNLLREMFPYTELPRVEFEDSTVPIDQPKKIWLTDTTFRDGQQARPPYTVDQVVDIFKLMSKLDGGAGIIRQSEFFVYSEKDRQAIEKCLSVGAKFPQVSGWIRATKSDFKLVKEIFAHTYMLGALTGE